MSGLKASNVSEELVSRTQREAGKDFVYGEIKPPAGVRFFARLWVQLFPQMPSSSLRCLRTGWIFDWLADGGKELVCIAPQSSLIELLPTMWPTSTKHSSSQSTTYLFSSHYSHAFCWTWEIQINNAKLSSGVAHVKGDTEKQASGSFPVPFVKP